MTDLQGEWRRGWPVVVGSIGGMMTVAAPSAITGMVMKPLQAEFAWSRAQISVSLMIVATCSLLFAPLAGGLITRFGPRRVALVSFATTAFGYALIGICGPSVWTWIGAWVIYGAFSVALGPIVWSSALCTLFDRHRGLALSIALSGGGFAFSVWPPIVAPLLAGHSWRWVYLMLAMVSLLVMLPLNFFALRALRQAPAGETPVRGAGAAIATPKWGPTLGQAMRSLLFWRIALGFILSAAINGSLTIHFYPILLELHFPRQEAAYLTAVMGPAMIVGRITTGWLLDRLYAPLVTGLGLMMPAISLVILMYMPTAAGILIASIVLGLSTGATTGSAALLIGRYFGLRHYASIFGVMIGIFGLSFGLIPTAAGRYFDVVGSYAPLFPILLVATVPLGLLFVTLGRYPEPGEHGR